MRQGKWGLLASAGVLALTGAAFGQGRIVADEIIITAQKREESLLDVPISVSAFTGEFLEATGIRELDDLADLTPGFELQLQSVNTPSYVIRGITSDVSEPNNEPNISVFFDGVPGSRGPGSAIELFDLERIEIAKGPQGTLFSRGASNGAVNFIMKKPTDDYEGSARVEFGNYENERYEGVVNLPLVEDALLLRLGAVFHQREGFTDNVVANAREDQFNGKDALHLRGAVTVKPAETFEVTLLGYFQHDQGDQTSFKTMTPALAALNGLTTDPNGDVAQDAPVYNKRDLYGATAIAEWQISDAFKLTSTSGYREYESNDLYDADGSGIFILHGFDGDDGNLFSQELRVNFDDGGRLRGFAGASYYKEEASKLRRFTYSQDNAATFLLPALGFMLPVPLPPLPTITEDTTLENENESFSVFADATFDLTEKLHLTAGLRWTVDDVTFSYRAPTAVPPSTLALIAADTDALFMGDLFGGLAPLLNPFSPGNPALAGLVDGLADLLDDGLFNGSYAPGTTAFLFPTLDTNALEGTSAGRTLTTTDEFDYLEPRIVLQYDFTPAWMGYASWSSGVRSGGLDIDPRAGLAESAYRRVVKPERVTSYELGTKGSFALGGTDFTGEAAAYFYDYDDFQLLILQGTSIIPANVGKASAYGAEFGLTADFNNGLSLFGNVSYIKGQVDEGVQSSLMGETDLEDNEFRLTPKWTLAGGLAYERAIAQELVGYGSLIGSYRSSQFFNPENEPELKEDGYALFTLNLGLRLQERYDLRFRVENLFEEEFIIDAGNTGRIVGIPTTIPGQPRFWTIGLGVKF